MTSRLSQMQAKFQQKQMQEKEEKLLKLYENQQQRAFERVGRGSAGSNGNLAATLSTGKVRQMFDERRQKAGIDRSYPLEPLKNNKPANARGASIERKNLKNVNTAKTSISTTRKSTKVLEQTKSEEIFNNNFEEKTYQEVSILDEADSFLKDNQDIVEMMEKQELSDSLDDEILPEVEVLPEVEEPEEIFTGKLANVGRKLPTQTTPPTRKTPVKGISNGRVTNSTPKTTPGVRRETKPAVKPATPKAAAVPRRSPASPATSVPASPIKKMSHKANQSGDKAGGSRPGTTASSKAASAVKRDELAGCRFCQRRFASDRLQTHEDICSRTAKKKRKTYDATKHRLQGTEIEPYVKKFQKTSGKVKPIDAGKSNWRQKHEEFIGAIRAAKQAQAYLAKGGNLKDLPPPPPSSNPDYVQCPHCGRKFNQAAAERHIPKCANYDFNKPRKPIPKK